jgi:hypothetical protein
MTTVTIQPNISNCQIYSSAATTNNHGTLMTVGEAISQTAKYRTLIKFDLTSIPSNATITSAIFSFYVTADYSSTARTHRVYRLLRAFDENTATWNISATGSNWTTAGGFSPTDCEQTDIGSHDMSAGELDGYKDFTLSNTAIQEIVSGSFTNNGFLLKADTEVDDAYQFASRTYATTTARPKLVIDYSIGGRQFQAVWWN